MKFWAKVRFKREKNAENLIRAFFKEFNPESSIVIRGEDAKVEIHFNNEPPEELIEAINHCDVVEFNFGKAFGEYSEDETEQVAAGEETSTQTQQVATGEETSTQTQQVATEEETSTQTERPKKKRGRPATKKAEHTKVANNAETVNVPQLEELKKKAKSFEHFVKLVAEWLEMNKRQNFFENLVFVSSELDKLSWKGIEKALEDKGVFYTQRDKIWAGQRVSEKLKDYSVTMLPLLNALVKYKEYSFGHKQSEENTYTEQATEEVTVEKKAKKNRVKMECMPEIPLFEETLGSVDKTQPIEERVKYVLTAMGWRKMNAKEQQEIFEIANTSVRLKRMDFNIIFVRANIPIESSMETRMTFSKFVNDFVSKYDADKKVKLLDFLKQLQEIVMFESEIESFTNFTD